MRRFITRTGIVLTIGSRISSYVSGVMGLEHLGLIALPACVSKKGEA
jgi:hypothetical protein